MQSELKAYKLRIIQAVGLLIVGFFGFSIADLCAKLLQEHYAVYQVLSVSGFIGTVVTGGWLLSRHGIHSFFPNNLKLHLIRGLVIVGTAFCMVSALKTLPMADFYGIVFTSPFILLILSVIFLKEHVGWRRWTAVSVAFLGVIILAGPQFNNFGVGFLYAAGGALCSAISVILVRKIGLGGPLPLYAFYSFLFITIINIICMIVTDTYIPFRMNDIVMFSFHGPGAILGIICTSIGYAKSPEAPIVAPFIYTQIIWGILFGWFFFGVVPIETTFIGLALIIGAGFYSIWREYRNAHDKHQIIPDIT